MKHRKDYLKSLNNAASLDSKYINSVLYVVHLSDMVLVLVWK